MTEARHHSASPARVGGCAGPSPRLGILLRRLAIVLVAVIFGLAVAVPGRGSARCIVAAFDAPPTAAAGIDQGTAKTDSKVRAQAATPTRTGDLKAIESDCGDGDEPLPEPAHGTASSLCCAPALGKPDRVLRGALLADTSRFAGRTHSARGPPVLTS
ncbi:hypothetical protein BH11MYX4_BH11MYX4_15770 [soil metagenome]